MEINLYNQSAEKIGTVELPENIFNAPENNDLLHQVVTSEISNQRQVLAHAKGRSEVRGGGRKPWRQKGTGRARHGSIRSPIWKGGGVTFGPTKERNFKKKINKKMARKALFTALSSKDKDSQIAVIDELKIQQPKTKEMAVIFKNLSKLFSDGKISSTLMVLSSKNDQILRASNNLKNLDVIEARNLNPLTVIAHKNLLLLKDSIDEIKKVFVK